MYTCIKVHYTEQTKVNLNTQVLELLFYTYLYRADIHSLSILGSAVGFLSRIALVEHKHCLTPSV